MSIEAGLETILYLVLILEPLLAVMITEDFRLGIDHFEGVNLLKIVLIFRHEVIATVFLTASL